jgi:hypothetical protein
MRILRTETRKGQLSPFDMQIASPGKRRFSDTSKFPAKLPSVKAVSLKNRQLAVASQQRLPKSCVFAPNGGEKDKPSY